MKVPEIVVVRTDPRWDRMVRHLGYKSVPEGEVSAAQSGQMVVRDVDLVRASQERLREAELIPDSGLSRAQLAHLRLARAIAATMSTSPLGVHAATIPPASDRMRTAGLYNTRTQEVLIDMQQLARGGATVDTVVHEIAHHTSAAEDMTGQHDEAMSSVATEVARHVAAGDFDELLREVDW